MKIITITLMLVVIIGIWVLLYPESELTIRAGDVRQVSNKLYQVLKTWANNRLQTHRLRQSLVQREVMLAHSRQLQIMSINSEQHELAAKAFRRTIVFQKHQKTKVVIPIGSPALVDFAENELNSYLLNLLVEYYPTHHWHPLETKRIPWTNYFYLTIKQK
ncbi:hypothetical protein [Limosilactobacillus reuteri]|uniref:hypothetical protein n=1 Tax=Limosilactobacillus reuteri TaxID=1598 RepID=UPI0023606B11|nr:hypothetical protein [Limosilactobacillus reuteri]MDD1381332.1 hypothetical protein [Limosilactobacillus reuteri]